MKFSKIILLISIIFVIEKNIFTTEKKDENETIVTKITGLTEITNIGDKPIIVGVHGVGEGGTEKIGAVVGKGDLVKKGGWWLYEGVSPNRIPKIKNHDLITFQWKQGKYTKGIRDKDIIDGARSLVNLILNILRDIKSREIRENKIIKPKIILIAHSMGGNVLKAAINLLDHKFNKIKLPEKTNIVTKIKKTIMGIIGYKETYQSPAEYDFIDTRYNENKKLTKSIKDKYTKKYYEQTNNEIGNRMLLMYKAKSIPKFPFIKACYTLGTPVRQDFPFTEDMNVTKSFYCLFSYGDQIQRNAGLTMISDGKHKYNIRVKIIKNGKEQDPTHNELVRNTTIIYKILDINEKNIKKIQDNEKNQIILAIFPENVNDNIKYTIDTSKQPKKTIVQKTLKSIELKV